MTSAADFKKFFEMADTDKSGELTPDELVKALKSAGFRGTNKQIMSMFRSSDRSGDGLVTLDEFLVSMGAVPETNRQEARMLQLFHEYDRDNSGEITADEVRKVFKELGRNLTDKETERMVFLMDGNKDGKVNYEEFVKYYST